MPDCQKPCPAVLRAKEDTTREIAEVRERVAEFSALTGKDVQHLAQELRDLRGTMSALPKAMAEVLEKEAERMSARLTRGEGKFDKLFDTQAQQGAAIAAAEARLQEGETRFQALDAKLTGMGRTLGKVRRWLQFFAVALVILMLGKGAVWAWPALEKLWGLIP
jgi:chromosome segregation ATPase